jgi:superfamily II DNA or RNA helicase
MTRLLFTTGDKTRGYTLRDYQQRDLDESFRLWDSGTCGVLTRIFTGGGKTLLAAVKMRRWLDRGLDHKCLVLSYEHQLVWQFAEEIEDVLGIRPGIEMGGEEVEPGNIPPITVATRQSLMCHELATQEQRDELAKYGLSDVRLLTKRAAIRAIQACRADADLQDIADGIQAFNERYECNHEDGVFTRLTKFDWRWNWLLVMDEAHKYSVRHKTCGHIITWFERNPNSRRSGITATPKRSDNYSIGSRLFPGVAIDYPFRDAVRDGYAVPFVQRFIQVEGVDFKRLKEESRGSQEKWDQGLDEILNTEEQLAKLCGPLLDMVGARRTLIFCPSVAMAENVSAFLNARAECECSCGTKKWFPRQLIGDGTKCAECGEWITQQNIVSGSVVAQYVHGGIPHKRRREIYRTHQSGEFQMLVVCSLCKEGYNDPDISCIAVFRPVSREAASLAEQMKGRGSRPIRGCINGLATREERLAAIRESEKPHCLIVDLVGVSGLSECASTVQIYADGLPEAIVERAEKYALEGGVEDPAEAVELAKRDDAEEKERQRREWEERERRQREEAERRSRLDAQVSYSTHEAGSQYMDAPRDPKLASEGQLKYLHMLGMDFVGWCPSKRQAGRMLDLFTREKLAADEVAYKCGIGADQWQPARASVKQIRYAHTLGILNAQNMTPSEVSRAIDRAKNPDSYPDNFDYVHVAHGAIDNAKTVDELTAAARRILNDRSLFSEKDWRLVTEYGKKKREELERDEF